MKRDLEALLVGCKGKGEEAAQGWEKGGKGTQMMNQGKSNEERPSLAAFSRCPQ